MSMDVRAVMVARLSRIMAEAEGREVPVEDELVDEVPVEDELVINKAVATPAPSSPPVRKRQVRKTR